jgi:hypothetical protein
MPPTQSSSDDTDIDTAADAGAETASDTPADLDVAEQDEQDEQDERPAGELPEAPKPPVIAPEPGSEVATTPAEMSLPDTTPESDEPATSSADALPEASLTSRPEAEAQAPDLDEAASAEPERRAPRGRFERFYAPGQGPRAGHNGHVSALANSSANGAARRPTRDQAPADSPSAAATSDAEEEEARPSGPREDVRGAVGELIDSLHALFTQDRAVATLGGASRCGLCYLHFPIGELVYREAEGFYVCQPCERALGSARVNMVRRQQKL